MNRPKIEDFMPEGTTFTDIHRKFRDNPDLYRYICALDFYIDELALYIDELEKKEIEEFFTATANPPPNVVLIYGDDLKEDQEEKPEKETSRSKNLRKLDENLAKIEKARKDRLKDTFEGMKD